MIARLAGLFSAGCFLLGALVLVAGAVITWMYCVTTLAIQFGPIVGFLGLFGSLIIVARYERYLKAPWQWWYEFWCYCDRIIHDRVGRKNLTTKH